MSSQRPPTIRKFPVAKQRQIDSLLEKNAEGKITDKEREKLQSLVREAEDLMVANSRRVAEFARSQSPQPPITAVPVTIWVNPQLAER